MITFNTNLSTYLIENSWDFQKFFRRENSPTQPLNTSKCETFSYLSKSKFCIKCVFLRFVVALLAVEPGIVMSMIMITLNKHFPLTFRFTSRFLFLTCLENELDERFIVELFSIEFNLHTNMCVRMCYFQFVA